MQPMNIEAGLSSSEAQSNKVGPFTATQGDWIVSGSGAATQRTAVDWTMLAIVAGVAVMALGGLAIWTRGR